MVDDAQLWTESIESFNSLKIRLLNQSDLFWYFSYKLQFSKLFNSVALNKWTM